MIVMKELKIKPQLHLCLIDAITSILFFIEFICGQLEQKNINQKENIDEINRDC